MNTQTMPKCWIGRGILQIQNGLISGSIKMKQPCSTDSYAMSSDSKPGHVFSCKRLHKAQKYEPCIWASNVAYTSAERGPLLWSKLLLELIILAEGPSRGTPMCPAQNTSLLVSTSEKSDRTNHLEGACKQEQCDSMRPMASKSCSC